MTGNTNLNISRLRIDKIEFESIETREMTMVKVEAKPGSTIFFVADECITLANLLKCAVQLHFNDKVISAYTNSTREQIARQAFIQ